MIDIDSYLMEEVRNEFLVDSNRKKLWKIELDIFQEFDRICKKYSLSNFKENYFQKSIDIGESFG